jgi:hypothetical protein
MLTVIAICSLTVVVGYLLSYLPTKTKAVSTLITPTIDGL